MKTELLFKRTTGEHFIVETHSEVTDDDIQRIRQALCKVKAGDPAHLKDLREELEGANVYVDFLKKEDHISTVEFRRKDSFPSEPLPWEIYSNWAETPRGQEKERINMAIHGELFDAHTFVIFNSMLDPLDERYAHTEVMALRHHGPYGDRYTILKNEPNLSKKELGLLLGRGYLKYGCFPCKGDQEALYIPETEEQLFQYTLKHE